MGCTSSYHAATGLGVSDTKMAAQYLIRFDDICPTLNWSIWEHVEHILLDCDVKPILAVVPDNQDPKLKVGEPNPNFWDHVRNWQQRGWTLGLHGYQHRYVTDRGGLMGINQRSEFSGLSCSEQESKLRQALNIFEREGVKPSLWIAPAHSFDGETLSVLRRLGIAQLSDGFSLYPHRDDHGTVWVPQQLWRFRKMPFGLWTVCMHFNGWNSGDILRFETDLRQFSGALTDWNSVISRYQHRRRSSVDVAFWQIYRRALKARQWLVGKN